MVSWQVPLGEKKKTTTTDFNFVLMFPLYALVV